METYKFWKGMRVRVVNPNEHLLSNPPMQQIEYPVNGQLETGYAYVKDLSDEPIEAQVDTFNPAQRILAHPSTRYEMNAAGYLERMELKLGGVIHVLTPHRGLHSEIGEMLYSLFNEAARQIEQHKDPSSTKCPRCNVYEIHPDSDAGWCKKCTGVLTGQKLQPMCMACGVKKADERSEHDFCYKCHFDLTDEILGQPSGSQEDEERLKLAEEKLAELDAAFDLNPHKAGSHEHNMQYRRWSDQRQIVKELRQKLGLL